jgi:hypothetical protein
VPSTMYANGAAVFTVSRHLPKVLLRPAGQRQRGHKQQRIDDVAQRSDPARAMGEESSQHPVAARRPQPVGEFGGLTEELSAQSKTSAIFFA